ncbi:MAG: hypothetical protein R3Y28_07710 [Candidatus Gastranaerophilales bacterium]
MDILYIIDRVELKYFEFNNLVTNFWLIKEFLNQDANVFITTIDKLSLKSGVAFASCSKSYQDNENICYEKSFSDKKIEDFQLVMFRQDPPVDADYINSTYIFDFVDREKTIIINEPSAVRDFNEKLHAIRFQEFMPENIVTASKFDIIDFLNTHDEIVLKPLGACFGTGVMTLKKGDKNTSVIINSVTNNQTKLIMVQKYLPKAVHGDKRVLFLGEEVLDVCVQKLPSNDDFKFNEHCDSNIVRAELSEQEKNDFAKVARELNKLGVFLVGLDVIDGKIIEINVTSPCYFIKEINSHFNIQIEKKIVDFILSKATTKQLTNV